MKINKLMHDLFAEGYLIDTQNKKLSSEEKNEYLIASIVIGIFSLGIPHLVLWGIAHLPTTLKEKINKIIHNDESLQKMKAAAWKIFPDWKSSPKLDFQKPKVDFSGLDVSRKEKKIVEKRCMDNFKNSMKAMDMSISDVVGQMIIDKQYSEYSEAVDQFSKKVLDVYEAYVDVQVEDNVPYLNSEIGSLKIFGYTHQDIVSFVDPCKKYVAITNDFIQQLKNLGISEKNSNELINYFADQKFDFKQAIENKEMPIPELLKDDSIKKLVEKLCKDITNDPGYNKIWKLEEKLLWWPLERSKIEDYKQMLAGLTDKSMAAPFNSDKKFRLLNEIQSRTLGGESEPGYVGNSLRMLNIVKGSAAGDELWRNKMYFVYKSKGIVNEIILDKELTNKINLHLKKNNKDWQIDENLTDHLRKMSPDQPIFKLGMYAAENTGGNLRESATKDQIAKRKVDDPNLSFAEAEKLAGKKNLSASAYDLDRPFRYKSSQQEEMAYLGTNRDLEQKELERREALTKNTGKTTNADTHFFETPLEYAKKTTPLPWTPGKDFYNLHGEDVSKSKYLANVKELGLPQQAGVSGSTEQTFTMAGVLGIQSPEELSKLRFVYLSWMGANKDHSIDEILIAAKSFGLPYQQSPDYYKQICPSHPEFIEKLKEAQKKRGFELPDYYLSNQASRKELRKIHEEKGIPFKNWKRFKLLGDSSDMKYVSPKVDLGNLQLTKSQKKVLKEACLEDFKKAQKSLEWAASDTCLSYFDEKNNPLLERINVLSKRYLDILRASVAVNAPSSTPFGIDPLHAELRSLFADSWSSSGSIGNSPLAIINLIEGKKDETEPPYALARTKLFFVYLMNRRANELLKSPELCQKTNQWLLENNKGWQLETGLIKELKKGAPFFMNSMPLFAYGVQAFQNYSCFLRIKKSIPGMEKALLAEPNVSFSTAEKAAVEKGPENLRFRTQFTDQEIFHYTGELPEKSRLIEIAEMEEKVQRVYDGQAPVKADTSYAESVADYKKKTTPLPWMPGKHVYNLHPNIPVKYNKIMKELGLEGKAGISGSIDQSLVMGGIVGMNSPEDLMDLRMIYMAWMLSSEDHSLHELMLSSKSFGMDYTPAPDAYKQIYPKDPHFTEKLAIQQKRRGFELPDFYLSNVHAIEKAKELFGVSVVSETKKAESVMAAMKKHEVLMKVLVPEYLGAYSNDPFGDHSLDWFIKDLSSKPVQGIKDPNKVKFNYNPETQSLEPHEKSSPRYYQGTKKTSVSLLPAHGKMLPFWHNKTDIVGLLFDRNKSEWREKYVLREDGYTFKKWWQRVYSKGETTDPNFPEVLKEEAKIIQAPPDKTIEKRELKSYQYLAPGSLQNLINEMEQEEKKGTFMKINEVNASLKLAGVQGLFCFNKKQTEEEKAQGNYEMFIKVKALSNMLHVKETLNVDVPIFIIDHARDQGLHHYPKEKQRADIKILLKNKNGEFDDLFNMIKMKMKDKVIDDTALQTTIKNTLIAIWNEVK